MLSGNRNFEGRVHPEVKMNYLASPPLVVAYALAGTLDVDLQHRPLGTGSDGKPVFLERHLALATRKSPTPCIAHDRLGDVPQELRQRVRRATSNWQAIKVPAGQDLRLGREVHLREAIRPTSTA